jgi:hypothetical protein
LSSRSIENRFCGVELGCGIYVPSVPTSGASGTPHNADGFVRLIVAFVLGLANDTITDVVCGLLWNSVSGYVAFIVRWGHGADDRLTPV